MKTREHQGMKQNLRLIALAGVITISGCRAAGYEIIDPVKDRQRPAAPDATTSLLPSARLEIAQAGKLIGVVKTNQGLTFRPSADTVDPDYVGKSPCANPGITNAEYQISIDGQKVASARQRGCEPLEVPYSFVRTGAQVVSLKVTSADGETANASQTVRVVDNDPCCSVPAPAVLVTAAPLVAYPNELVKTQAKCLATEAGTVSWKFGDGATALGGTSSHSFEKVGQYVITATCTLGNGKKAEATVTVSVIPSGRPRPQGGSPTLPSVIELGMPPSQVPPNQSDPSQN
jgi:hypothetical protein